MLVCGLDIGGANLKVATSDGSVRSIPFPLWQHPETLADTVTQLTSSLPDCAVWAMTMTGELADCFASKAEGVAHIVDNVVAAANGVPVLVWQTGGEFLDPDEAINLPQLVSAANWHALATWIGRAAPQGTAILLDIGSTTTDIIPLQDGLPMPQGRTDLERLRSRELLYTGVRRTPLCAVVSEVTYSGDPVPIAAELFATTADVNVVLSRISESPDRTDTADGRPLTLKCCRARLARMLCADADEIDVSALDDIALEIADRQRRQIAAAVITIVDRLSEFPSTWILSGEGRWLAAEALGQCGFGDRGDVIDLGFLERSDIATAACAYAVARLAAEAKSF